jgi:hypothetical protein
MSIGRMDIAVTHLRTSLHNPGGKENSRKILRNFLAVSAAERKKLADVLFKCYIQKYLHNVDDFMVTRY